MFTGFPIGMALGINAVTHRGLISAITPIVIPQLSGQQLEKDTLARLIAPYDVFLLDAPPTLAIVVVRFTILIRVK